MQAQQYARRYSEAQVTVVDRKRLLLLVLEGGQRFLTKTRDALAAGDLVGFAENLRKAQGIITELLSTLDHEAGGQIARDLARLYDFMLFHLTEANVKRSVRHVEDVQRVFATIADAFREIIEGAPAATPGTGA